MTRQLTHHLTRFVLLCAALACFSVAAVAQNNAWLSDYKPGSILFYPKYTSNPSAPQQGDTQINITNTSRNEGITVHLFAIDGSSCSVADSFISLTQNQTASILMSDFDPGVTGYLIGVAVADGPTQFNWLIGDEYIREADRLANLQAIGVSKISPGSVAPNADGLVELVFNGTEYEQLPASVGLSTFNSQVTDSTQVNLFSPSSNLLVGTPPSTARLFLVVYNDVETPFSTNVSVACFATFNISSLRVTGGINNIVPAGRTGWIRFEGQGRPVLGYAHNRGTVFNGGHNLHALTRLGTFTILAPSF